MSTSTLTLGEKIKQIRKAKGLSQENMARAIKRSQPYVNYIETGRTECTSETLMAIKKFLEIENAPLLEHEIKIYKDRLWVWNEMLLNNRFTEARDMRPLLAPILDLHFERDLIIIFTLIEAHLFYMDGADIRATEANLSKVDDLIILEEASPEALFLYHRRKGVMLINYGDLDNAVAENVKKAMWHFLQMIDIKSDIFKPDAYAIRNIALCYTYFGNFHKAIQYYERILYEFKFDYTQDLEAVIKRALSLCFYFVGEFGKAERLFMEAAAHFKTLNDGYNEASSLINLALVFTAQGKFEDALSIFNQIEDYIIGESSLKGIRGVVFSNAQIYLQALWIYYKALCLWETKSHAKAKEVLNKGKEWAKQQGNERYAVLIETGLCLLTLNDAKSSDYIQNTAIPSLLAKGSYLYRIVMRLCQILEAHYNKRGATRKALEVSAIERDLYKTMLFGGSELG